MKRIDDHMADLGLALKILKTRRRVDHTQSWAVDKIDVRAEITAEKEPAEPIDLEGLKGMWLVVGGNGPLIINAVISPTLTGSVVNGVWRAVLELVCEFPSNGQNFEIERVLHEEMSEQAKDKENAKLCLDALEQLADMFSVSAAMIRKAYLKEDDNGKSE